MSEPVDIATQLMREFAALNTATERAHRAIADMRAERKMLAALRIEVREATQRRAEEMVIEEVRRALDEMVPKCKAAVDEAVEKVFGKFDRITKMLTGEEGHPDRPPIESLIAKAKQAGMVVKP
jgi:hypothetical protein